MKVSRQHIRPDSVLGDRYRVIRALGQGGMAHVYLAEDLQTGAFVALKVMRDELTEDSEFLKRFANEARSAAKLDHPNIVRVLDYGQDGDVRFIVQEYVEGMTLKDMIKEKGGINWKLAVPLMIQIAAGLEHAHRNGVIHRDLKPQNVLVTPDMVAKVTDFGIARTTNANTITLTGGVAFGSVHYFSPEQARGVVVTERSDLYSLGIILYEMLTGQVPFEGETSVAVAIKQLQDMPPNPAHIVTDLPNGLVSIIFKAIQKIPDNRYQSAREFMQELSNFLRNPQGHYGVINHSDNNWTSGTTAIGVSTTGDYSMVNNLNQTIVARRRSRYRDSILVLVIILVIVALLGVVFMWVQRNFRSIEMENTATTDVSFVLKDYNGQSIQTVMEELEKKYGFEYGTDYFIEWEVSKIEPNNIFKQDPAPNTKIRKGKDVITFHVSSGINAIEVPDLVGQNENIAVGILQDAGFSVTRQYEKSDSVDDNLVIRTSPEAGSSLPVGGEVVLYVASPKSSNNSQQVFVPYLSGVDWATAVEQCNSLGLKLVAGNSISRDGSGNPVDVPESQRYIWSQNPQGGTKVVTGSTVTVDYGTAQDLQGNNDNNSGDYSRVMPDFTGQKWLDVYNELQSWQGWPANSGVQVEYYSEAARELKNSNSDKLYVMNQSVQGGTNFNPAEMTLSFTIGTYEDLQAGQ